MPAIPEGLYTSTLRDSLSPGLEIFLRDISTSTNGVNVEAIINIPSDRILILSAATNRAEFTAGVGNGLENMVITVTGPSPFDRIVIASTGDISPVGAVNIQRALSFSGEVWVPAGGFVSAIANFTVADASNNVLLELAGVLIPRGNVLSAGG